MGIKGWVSKADASGLPKIGQAVLFNDEGWIRSFPVLPADAGGMPIPVKLAAWHEGNVATCSGAN